MEIMHKIDNERGDISRSRFMLRLIEKAYEETQHKEGGYGLK